MAVMRNVAATALFVAGLAVGIDGQTPQKSRVLLLFVDDLHLDFALTPRMREVAVRTVRAVQREGDVWAVVSTGSSGVSELPTSDAEVPIDAIRRVIGDGLKPRQFLEMRQRPEGVEELRRRAAVALSTAASAIDWLAARNMAPAAVLYFSSGYDAEFVDERTALTEKAIGTHTVIYAIDPRGFLTSAPEYLSRQADWDATVTATRPSLAALASETDGLAVFSVRDLEAAISRLASSAR